MTTAVNGRQLDPIAVLTRADKRWCDRKKYDTAAEPEYIAALAAALTPLIAGEHNAEQAPAPAVDPAEVQRLEDLVAELRRQVDGHAHTIARQKGEITALKMERKQLQADLAAASKTAPDTKHLDTMRAEINRLQGLVVDADRKVNDARADRDTANGRVRDLGQKLAEATRDADTWQAEYERVRDEKLDDIVALAAPVHEHRYPINPDTRVLDPCSCGLVFPRDTLAAHQEEDDEDDVDETEPISTLMDRLREQLAGWGETA
jgi:DNA repair exonuclease SbcCD ATPase subunit